MWEIRQYGSEGGMALCAIPTRCASKLSPPKTTEKSRKKGSMPHKSCHQKGEMAYEESSII